jgi:hypothetical protein
MAVAATIHPASGSSTAHPRPPSGSVSMSDDRSGYARFQNHKYKVAWHPILDEF